MGEEIGNEEELMPFISSANIACGYHAGNKGTMQQMVEWCLQYNVAIGAHPSFADKENFGRIDLVGKGVELKDIYAITLQQIIALQEICQQANASLHHVKPHGGLYNRAAWDEEVAGEICRAIVDTDPMLTLYGLSGSKFEQVAKRAGLHFVHEVFADRTYQNDGSLTPRAQSNALIQTAEAATEQAILLATQQHVITVHQQSIILKADTICLHGDGTHAASFATAIRTALEEKGIDIKKPAL
jgi:UPF0271 protein